MVKYRYMKKEDKKKVRDIYKKDYAKSEVNVRLTRIKIYTVIAVAFALFLLFYNYYIESETSNIVIACTLLVLAVVFIIGIIVIKRRMYDKIANEKKLK